MAEQSPIKSRPFEAPFVRVRGRLSRQDVVTWSPCLRTFHQPNWFLDPRVEKKPRRPLMDRSIVATRDVMPREGLPGTIPSSDAVRSGGIPNPHLRDFETLPVINYESDRYFITFEDAQGRVLTRAPVRIRFFANERQRALFRQRLPYYRDTHRVVLYRGERELGALIVPKKLPEFVLTFPIERDEVDPNGVLHLRWDLDATHEAFAKKHPLTYYVRYSADSKKWNRPGVNISDKSFDLDLRMMPGGDHCMAQVIATNGYQTSFVETPSFAVPRKPPEVLSETSCGPLLFAQGFSHEEGPLVDKSIAWFADGNRQVGIGASFDARRLGARTHTLEVRVTDSTGVVTVQYLGRYNGRTGMRVALPGY